LNGTVNPNGTSTTVYFQYGTTTNYGSTSGTATATGTTTQSYHLNLSSLSPGQTYHYRFVGNYSGGTVYGGDMSFTTTGGASPTITTTAATNVASTTATLNGTVNPNGTSTTVYFQYGTTTNYGSTSGSATATGTTTLSYNLSLSSLTPGQTYHYRFAGNYSSGTVYGGDMSFTTQSSSGTPAQMTSTSSAITFNWSAGTATMYELSVGTSAGGSDLYDSGQTTALTATTQNNIPNNGSTIYVRLSSLVNGNWQSTDYTYTSFH
jgi:phosphodiesterase/alkaline phosphatase D-like protein